jgi:hypothetical protein
MTPVPQRTCAVPDLGGELLDPLRLTEEVLQGLAEWESDEAGDGLGAPLPPPLAHNRALDAVRLLGVLAGTQGRDSARAAAYPPQPGRAGQDVTLTVEEKPPTRPPPTGSTPCGR